MCIFFHTDVFIDVSLMSQICKVSQAIFGQYSQHLVDTVTFKCRWNIGRLSVVYNTMCFFRVFLKVSSILETSITGDPVLWTL